MDPSPGREPARSSLADSPEIIDRVRELYVGELLTERQVATRLGIGRNAVRRIMDRYGIPKRKSWDYDRSGERNNRWRTENLRYDTLHVRVTAARGKPVGCWVCDEGSPDRRYEWANLTGNYADVHDYARMCVPCHRRFDRDRRVATGEPTSPFVGGGSQTRVQARSV